MAEAHEDKVKNWIVEHCADARCPMCRTNEPRFGVGEIVELYAYKGGKRVQFYRAGREIHPVVPIICENCGYVFLMNAVIMGVA
ncbi:hypothetical protein LCGC14_1925540 [marine sediment metagenome]|uniref:Uncharacterized protein n=1 Tax=marine sediment metagenome TaxID=412755 RepID=A0A0F9IMB9_9ZZZZ